MKTATISFGQAMPEIQMARAQDETLKCDLFIVLGQLAGGLSRGRLPAHRQAAWRPSGDPEPRPTDQDDDADLVVHGEIGPT